MIALGAPDAASAAIGLMAVALTGRIATVGVGLVFLTAAAGKLRHRVLLPGVIANYRLLPPALVAPVASALPVAELVLGAWLLSGLMAPPAAALAVLLLGIFAWAMAVNLRRGRGHIDCGCGHAALRQPLAWPLVMRNVVLAALLLPALATAPLPGQAWLLGAAGGIVLFLLVQLFNAIVALAGSPLAPARKG